MSSAKRQNSRRIRKWAAALRLVAAPAQLLGQARRSWRAASSVTCGGRLRRAERVGLGEDGAQQRQARRVEQVVQPDLDHLLDGVGEVGVDLEAVHVAHDQERRVLQDFAVLEELLVGGVEVLVLALVLPGEEALLPDVGPALAAALLARPILEGKACPVGSASAGVGWPTRRQRSRKCSWAAERSLSVTWRHLATNSWGENLG